MSQIWQVIVAQMRYFKNMMVFATTLLVAALLVLIFAASKIEQVESIMLVLLIAASLGVQVACWFTDLKERRVLLLLSLPLSRWRVAFGFFLVPMVVQAVLTCAVLAPIPWLWLRHGTSFDVFELLARLFAISGGMLVLIYGSELFCELLIRISGSKILIVGANVLFAVFIFTGGFGLFNFVDLLTGKLSGWASWGAGLSLLVLTMLFFVARANHTMGIHPVYGTPQDWSTPSSDSC